MDYDWLVVGSGFGGSVSALRLREKGYSVGVLECGRRFADLQVELLSERTGTVRLGTAATGAGELPAPKLEGPASSKPPKS